MVAPGQGRLEPAGSESWPPPGTSLSGKVRQETARVANNQTCPASPNRRNASGTGQRRAALPCSAVLSPSPV